VPVVADRVAVIVLAAGSSTRLGRLKQLADLEGRPLLQHAVDAAAGARVGEVVVVLGAAAAAVAGALVLPDTARVVENPDHASGQASSLRAGLDALDGGVGRAVVILGDQPRLPVDAIRAVAAAAGPIARAVYRGTPGHPVAFDREVWPELRAVTGDRGARDVIALRQDRVTAVAIDAGAPGDVDTDEDLLRERDAAGS